MNLQRFDPATDADAVRACHEIYSAGAPIDAPGNPVMSYQVFRGWLIYGWTEDPSQAWLATGGAGGAHGWYQLTLPERENRRHAQVSLAVHPSRRRAGLGRALLRHAAGRARQAGRVMLGCEAREGTPGEAFARALGARPGLTDIHRLLRLDRIPPGHLASLREPAERAARGYSLLHWEGPVPEDRVTQVAALNEAMADAPQEAGHEPQRWDARRLRQSEQRAAAQGLRYYSVAAVEDATGDLAALTQIGTEPPRYDWAFQEMTAVARPHRGHRLGLLVKVAMLQLLAEREPRLTHILTGNADGNEHMIAINTQIGFEILDRWTTWQLDLGSAAEPGPGGKRRAEAAAGGAQS